MTRPPTARDTRGKQTLWTPAFSSVFIRGYKCQGCPSPERHGQTAVEPTHAASHLPNSPSTLHPCCYHLPLSVVSASPDPSQTTQHGQPPSPLCSRSSSPGPLMLEQPLGQPCSQRSHAALCSRWHGVLTVPHVHPGTDGPPSGGPCNTESEPASCRLGD